MSLHLKGRFVSAAAPEANNDADSRTIRFVLSDSSVARDGHTLATSGWNTSSYLQNPVVLFGHDSESVSSVIGRMTSIFVRGDQLVGDVQFAPADVNPTAETVYQMVRQGFLNAVSVGFIPTAGKPAKGRGQGAYDFSAQDLLEVSVVPVPALPTALAEARSAGIDVEPALEWARALLRSETVAPYNAATFRAGPAMKRDLYDVSSLASMLMQLAWLQDWVSWEAEQEGDGSDIPGRILEALKSLGGILVDMTAEEVAELLSDLGVEQEVDQDEAQGAVGRLCTGLKRSLGAILRHGFGGARQQIAATALTRMGPNGLAAALRGGLLDQSARAALADLIESRAGRVLSSANEETLRAAHGHITEACDLVRSVVDQVDPGEDPGEDDDGDGGGDNGGDDEAAATRSRRARALQMKHGRAA